MTTPAGINPFTGDPNWQRIASYLIGPTANGITLDANGSLLLSTSSVTYTGTAPIRVNGSVISLTTTSPVYVNNGSLSVAATGMIIVSGSALSHATPSSTNFTITTLYSVTLSGSTLTLVAGSFNVDPTGHVNGTGNIGSSFSTIVVPSVPGNDGITYVLTVLNGTLAWVASAACT